MPVVAMGTWSGSYGDCKSGDFLCAQQHARFSVETWLNIGGTHIDGANDYRTQTSIAEALTTSGLKREDVFITTKCPGAIGHEALIQCADDNLQMLGQFGANGVQYIDLLLIHFPFIVKPVCRFNKAAPECKGMSGYTLATKEQLQETWKAMEELKKIGVVKSIGISDYTIQNIKDTLEIATEPIDLNQVEWNPYHQDHDMLDFCKEHGILLQAWSPLGGTAGSPLSDPVLKKIAAAHNVSTAQVALKWAVQAGVAVVVGTTNPEHAASDKDLFSFTLTDDEMKTISALQPPSSSTDTSLVV